MGMMGVFLWTIGSVQTEEGGKKMTNRCHICGRMKPMTEASICDSCKDAMRRNGYIKVLRCKDCVNCVKEPNGELYCDILAVGYEPLGSKKVHEDWYCADGERKEEDD